MRSLQAKMIATLTASMCLALLVVLVVDFVTMGRLVVDNSALEMELTCKELASNVNAQVKGIEQSTNTMYEYAMTMLADNPGELATQEGIDRFISSFYDYANYESGNTYGAITSYMVLNPAAYGPRQGFFLTRNSLSEPMRQTEMTDVTAYSEHDLEHVGWYYIPVKKGEPTWMSPYLNDNIGVWMTSYVIPMKAGDGSILGIAGMDLDFTLVLDFVRGARVYSDDGSAALFDADGKLIYQRDFAVQLGGDADVLKNVESSLSDAEAASLGELRDATMLSAETEKPVTCNWNGERYLIVGHKIENGMTLAAMAPERDIMAPVWGHLGICAAVAALIMFLAWIAAMLVTRSITKPLRDLANAANEISRGNLDVTIDTTAKDEVGQLSRAFQKMAADLRERIDTMSLMAFVDPLTGIGNRTAYASAVESLKREIAAGTADFTLVVFDLNGLKLANDTYGHQAGDELIVDAATAITGAFGEGRVYRYGGDEFAAILTGIGEVEPAELGRTIEASIEAVRQANSSADGTVARAYSEPLSIAWGITTFDPARHASYDDVFEEADTHMYANKMARR